MGHDGIHKARAVSDSGYDLATRVGEKAPQPFAEQYRVLGDDNPHSASALLRIWHGHRLGVTLLGEEHRRPTHATSAQGVIPERRRLANWRLVGLWQSVG